MNHNAVHRALPHVCRWRRRLKARAAASMPSAISSCSRGPPPWSQQRGLSRSPAGGSAIGLHPFHAASNVRAETSYVLFGDTRPEDIEANGQLVGRLWT